MKQPDKHNWMTDDADIEREYHPYMWAGGDNQDAHVVVFWQMETAPRSKYRQLAMMQAAVRHETSQSMQQLYNYTRGQLGSKRNDFWQGLLQATGHMFR